MNRLYIIFIMVLMCFYTYTLDGVGYGKNADEAKDNAIKDLAGLIESQVSSTISRVAEQTGNGQLGKFSEYVKTDLSVRTDLPIMGAAFKISPAKGTGYNYIAYASFDKVKAIPLYREKCTTLFNDISKEVLALKSSSGVEQYAILTRLLTLVTSYNKYRLVGIYLDVGDIQKSPLSIPEIHTQIDRFASSSDSIEKGAFLISEEFKRYKPCFIYPPVANDSEEVTMFGKVLSDYLNQYNANSLGYDKTEYLLRSSYQILDTHIHMTSHLTDKKGQVIQSKVTSFLPSSYNGISYQPKHSAISQLLSNAVSSDEMNVEVLSNKGKRDLMFVEDDEVELLVKLNTQGYIYIIGHVLHDEDSFSYLLELNEGQGDRRFVMFVNQDDANKWISLGKFTISEPFGVESLQVFASTSDLTSSVPATRYDDKSGYYVFSNEKPEAVVTRTRGLKPKESKKVKNSESSLMFTTYSGK